MKVRNEQETSPLFIMLPHVVVVVVVVSFS
jgi:hypothetical protein